jgi:putative SOS response-associated peptidase YedK
MCYHKSEVQKYNELMDHYSASFNSITEEVELIKERFEILLRKDDRLNSIGAASRNELGNQLVQYSQKDALPANLTQKDLSDLKWYLKTINSFKPDTFSRFHENGFDYLPTPILTAGDPENFKMFRWGLIPFYMKDKAKAWILRTKTLNCISEEMFSKDSFRDAVKNEQRCLIPVTGFFEWRWFDPKGTVKIPYYVTFRDQRIRSMAGLYSRWKDPETGEYYYSYTVLTTKANTILDYVHNNKKRMPVFIHPEDEKTWLTKGLSKDKVLEMCQPYEDSEMRAYTISKLLTTKNVNTNVPEVLQPMNYELATQIAGQYLKTGDKKRALEAFINSVGREEKYKLADVEKIVNQGVLAEL